VLLHPVGHISIANVLVSGRYGAGTTNHTMLTVR
jgi:hypothetical protein